MGMNVGGGGDDEQVIATINTTPLVDVMLVLLIIFLITVPVITKTVKLDLPKASNTPTQTKPENITIAVDVKGNIYWNDGLIPDNAALQERLAAVARQTPQPEIHVRGDRSVRYEYVGRVITMCQRAGISKVGFISEPDRGVLRRN